MLSLWFIQQYFNKDSDFGLKKHKIEEEAGEKGKEETQRETNEGGRQGLFSSMKDGRRWTRGREG